MYLAKYFLAGNLKLTIYFIRPYLIYLIKDLESNFPSYIY